MHRSTKNELLSNIKEMLRHRSGTTGEDLIWYDKIDKKWYKSIEGIYGQEAQPNEEMYQLLAEQKESRIISFHNHPYNIIRLLYQH